MDGPDTPEPNLYLAWYEAWMAEQDARRAAEAEARAAERRGVRVLALCLVAWAVAAGLAGILALSVWTGG